jgi:hypothetical protein
VKQHSTSKHSTATHSTVLGMNRIAKSLHACGICVSNCCLMHLLPVFTAAHSFSLQKLNQQPTKDRGLPDKLDT